MLKIYNPDFSWSLELIYADDGIRAGFPSPAQDYITETIDLNRTLIEHPAATFYARVVGDSMSEEGIEEDDILAVILLHDVIEDRSKGSTAIWPSAASTANSPSSGCGSCPTVACY